MKKTFLLFCLITVFVLTFGTSVSFGQSSNQIISNYLLEQSKNKISAASDLKDWVMTDNYTDKDLGLSYAYVQQRVNTIPVFNAISVFVIVNNEVAYFQPDVIPLQNFSSVALQPVLTPQQAIAAAAQMVGVSDVGMISSVMQDEANKKYIFQVPALANSPVLVELVYTENEGTIFLTWNVSMDMKTANHWWNVRLDAVKGSYIEKNDYVTECSWTPSTTANPTVSNVVPGLPMMMPPPPSSSPSYLVFKLPNEAPSFSSRDTLFNPANPTASPFGWHDTNGIAGAEFTTTKGNNTITVEDADANNTGGYSPSGGANNDYNFSYDPTQTPLTNRDAALTNLFYMVNRCHDLSYLHGFTEAAGNFQTNNYGNGGLGNDQVMADGLDGSGTNNANFSTPVDGTPGRMQMFVFNLTTPNRDGDFDNGVIAHEFCHGISNRLTGGPSNSSCLSNAEQGGEGWSDWFALVLTIEPTDHGSDSRGIGTYVLGQATSGAGIRRFPYSTNMTINPQTYANVAQSTEVHNIGEIWCDALWDMTWGLIDASHFSADPNDATAGNNIAIKLVLQGMKLQPCGPGFIDARNAILSADDLLYGGSHKCIIWNAFARRGMGFNASQGSANSATDQTADFTLPSLCTVPVAPPVAAFTAPSTAGCTSSVTFTDASTQPTTFLWNFGDGGTSTLQSPTHSYTSAGTFNVKLKVTNVFGSDSVTHSITITSTYGVTASASPTSVCAGSSVNLSSTLSGITSVVSGYNLSSIPYAPVAGTGTSVTLGDDQTSAVLPIGFNFDFFGNTYSNFYICSNGFITFSSGQGSPFVAATIPAAATPNNFVALFWADLNPSIGGSFINYFVNGTAPNRQLIINYHTFHFSGSSFPFFGQIILNETSNTIELHSTTITLMTGANKTTQGIENANGSAGVAVTGRNNVLFGTTNDAFLFTPIITQLPFAYSWQPGGANTANTTEIPAGSGAYTVTVTSNGCNVFASTQNITVTPNQNWYPDVDGDTYGDMNSTATVNCVNPGGMVTNNTDCNDNNNLIYQTLTGYTDADGDGYTVGAIQNICSGATLPSGYSAASLGTDCDDNNITIYQTLTGYTDVDGDGYTVGNIQSICSGASLPSGYSATSLGTDCNDNNINIYQTLNGYTDADGDGYTVGNIQSICSGASLPSGYSATSLGTDCDDNNLNIHSPVSYYQDNDGDGYGSAVTNSFCQLTAPVGYSTSTGDCNDAVNTINPHGAPYSLNITNLASNSATVNWTDGSCGFETSYQSRRRPVGTLTWTYVASPPTEAFRNYVNLLSNTQYEAQVRSRFGTDSSVWSPLIVFTTLPSCDAPTSISATNISNTSATINFSGGTYGQHIVQYRSASFPVWTSVNLPASASSTVLNGLTPNTAYQFRIRTKCGPGITSAFSSTGTFTTSNTRLQNPELNEQVSAEILAQVSPNPNDGSFMITGEVNFDGILSVKILDVTGREIYSNTTTVDGMEFSIPVSMTDAAAGIYFVYISGNDATQTLKLIKQ